MEEAEGAVNDRKNEMLQVLEKNLAEVKERMSEQTGKINVENLIVASTSSSQALDDLGRLKKRFEDLRNKAQTFNSYQTTMEVQETPLKEINDFDKKFEVRYRLWKCRDSFDENNKHWLYDTFLELGDVAEIEKTVRDYERELVWLK